MRILALTLTILMMLASPAAAGTAQDPEMLDDACGFATDVENEVTLPWLDLCRVWFETVPSDVPTVKVTMEVAGGLQDRPESQYWVAWEAGDCHLEVHQYDDGDGATPAGASFAEVMGRCADDLAETCLSPLDLTTVCRSDWTNITEVDISSGYVEDDDSLSWTVRFDGPLARFATRHEPGDVLTPVEAYSSTATGAWGVAGVGFCRPDSADIDAEWRCPEYVAERIYGGRDYVVGS